MFITALCPSYRRPELLANTIQLWIDQEKPEGHEFELLIFEDSGLFDSRYSGKDHYALFTSNERLPSLPAKYNSMLELADDRTDAFLVWEDDDIYLPGYLKSYTERFVDGCDYIKPDEVLGDYTGKLVVEKANGRFHSSLGFTKKLINDIGGWPKTDRADFDQMLIATLEKNCRLKAHLPFNSCGGKIQYIYAWHTGHPHGQHAMSQADDTMWYEKAERLHRVHERVELLKPMYDKRTLKLLEEYKSWCKE